MNGGAGEWVSIAVLGRPRGNRGELTAISLSSKPDRFARLRRIRLLGDGSEFDLERVWDHEGTLIFKFSGVNSISEAEKLRGAEVQVPESERITLEADEYFHSDLIGCEVRERGSGRVIGRVTDIEEFGGPVLLEIDHGRVNIPFVKAICSSVRLPDHIIEADLPEGLEDLAAE